MSGRAYTPGSDADAIVERQLAKGCYASADEVVRVGLELLQQSEAELEALMRLIDEQDSAEASDAVTTGAEPSDGPPPRDP